MRFAVLGTGHWAATVHAAALASHPTAELVAVWGRDADKAATLANRFGARGGTDLDAVLATVDAVAVALPPDVQAIVAARAANAGRHLLLDKPLALTAAAADDVVRAADDAGVASVVFFTNRFVEEMGAFLDRAADINPDGARVAMLGSIRGDDNPYRDSAWRYEHGGLWDLGPHALSLLIPVLGPVVAVTAARAPHATTHVIAEHAGGAVSTMALSVESPVSRQEFAFSGPGGELAAPAAEVDPRRAFGAAIDDIQDLVATGRHDHPCGVRFAREVTAVLSAAQLARDTGVRRSV